MLCRPFSKYQIGKDAIVRRVECSLSIALIKGTFVFGVLLESNTAFVIFYEETRSNESYKQFYKHGKMHLL